MTNRPDYPLVTHIQRLIGRKPQLQAIFNAIAAGSRQSRALYFVAPGGLGKTRLLQEVAAQKGDWDGTLFRCTPLIDLYHTDLHSPNDLRQAIINGLDPELKHFLRYEKAREDFERQREAGISDRELEQHRRKLDSIFTEEYARLARNQRLVIILDTLEQVQHEDDFVMEICQVENVDTMIKTWMVKRLSKLPNTVVLFAGRPHEKVENELEKQFVAAGYTFNRFQLTPFNFDECKTFLDTQANTQQHAALRTILDQDPRLYQRIYQLSQGKPIYLALIIDFLLYGRDIGSLFPVNLDTAPPVTEAELGHILVRFLLEGLSPNIRRIMHWLLFARKGLHTALLAHLEPDWELEKVTATLFDAQQFAVVKVREETPGVQQLFLHDELYDIFDRYFKGDVMYSGDYRPIAEYYRLQLENPKLTPGEREELNVIALYYELQVNLDEGYHKFYTRWSYEAIKDHELGYDMRLRDEILRFLNRYTYTTSEFYDARIAQGAKREQIDRDCAVRWVWRHHVRGETTKAREVASRLRNSQEASFNWEQIDDPLYQADLLTTLAVTRVHEGEAAEDLLKEAIMLAQEATNNWNTWERQRILGLAYDQLGYLYRVNGHYSQARHHYLMALPHFQGAELQNELGMTLNNLAYVQALLGRPREAQAYVDRALAIRRKIGHKYRLALSLNTRGRIFTLQDQSSWGIKMSEEALEICKILGAERGVGLAYNALGFSWRKKGNEWKLDVMTIEEAEEAFTHAEDYLLQAVDLFTHFSEPIRQWEANNELGSLYGDWAWLYHQKDKFNQALRYYKDAIRFQERAIKVAREHDLSFQLADSSDDLAEIKGDMSRLLQSNGRIDKAQQARSEAETLLYDIIRVQVPDEFKLTPGQGFTAATELGEAYWLSLGKANLWLGVWRFRDVVESNMADTDEQETALQDASRHLILAIAYFQRYNPTSYDLERTLGYLSRYWQQIDRSNPWAWELLKRIETEYALDLHIIHDLIGQTFPF